MRPHRRAFLGGAAALAVSPWLSAKAQTPGATILSGGRITTLNPTRPEAEAIAIRGGLVLATGDRAEMREALPGAREIDLGGRRVIPGLNDSHLHATRGARFYALELRWDGVPTLARGLEMVAEQAARTPTGQWVRVMGGWSRHQFEERRLPMPAELTEAAPDVPVFVLYLYSRAFLNAAGARAAGLTPQGARESEGTPGRYEITEDGGAILYAEPSSGEMNRIIAELPGLDAAAELSSARHFYRELARFGLTSVGDLAGGGHVYPDGYAATLTMAEAGEMAMRISNFLPPQEADRELEILQGYPERYALNVDLADRLRHAFTLEGAGEAIDLSFYDFENFMAPRPDLPPRGEADAELQAIVRHLLRERWPIRIHATYDETIRRMMDVFEAAHAAERDAGRAGFHGIRWAVEHAETIRPATIARIAVQDRMAFAGEIFADRYGMEAAAEAPPLADIVAAGVPLGLGTDGTRAASYHPWTAFDWAVTGRTVGGTVLLAPRHRRTRLEALSLYTVGSAWFSGDEARKGRLAPGQYADLAVLDRDVLTIPTDEMVATLSLLTLVGGQATHADGPYADLLPALPQILPDWSPVRRFGGHQS
ncbi:amidohydrolase [Jannaschia sp. S6380]|uniref:amidohydrolase n=1 Tax=Jannaschia sp. S6380 TaxID=2926408 RepID=UPI001FF135CF|nr:amidohydrolase [Jannaschia sp. S6380]MCK0167260.1 amidohydrolase [Jannaschia sp. S6380]